MELFKPQNEWDFNQQSFLAIAYGVDWIVSGNEPEEEEKKQKITYKSIFELKMKKQTTKRID